MWGHKFGQRKNQFQTLTSIFIFNSVIKTTLASKKNITTETNERKSTKQTNSHQHTKNTNNGRIAKWRSVRDAYLWVQNGMARKQRNSMKNMVLWKYFSLKLIICMQHVVLNVGIALEHSKNFDIVQSTICVSLSVSSMFAHGSRTWSLPLSLRLFAEAWKYWRTVAPFHGTRQTTKMLQQATTLE